MHFDANGSSIASCLLQHVEALQRTEINMVIYVGLKSNKVKEYIG